MFCGIRSNLSQTKSSTFNHSAARKTPPPPPRPLPPESRIQTNLDYTDHSLRAERDGGYNHKWSNASSVITEMDTEINRRRWVSHAQFSFLSNLTSPSVQQHSSASINQTEDAFVFSAFVESVDPLQPCNQNQTGLLFTCVLMHVQKRSH